MIQMYFFNVEDDFPFVQVGFISGTSILNEDACVL